MEKLNLVQEKIVRIINSLIENNKTVIVTGNNNSENLSKLNKDLIEKIREGTIYEMKYPNENVRMKIIENSIRNTALESFSKDIKEYICNSTNGINVRKLLGILNRLNAEAFITNSDLSLDEVKDILK